MMSMLVTFLSTCSTVAAVLIGGTAVLVLSGLVFYLAFRFARYWLNKFLTDLIDLHGIPKVREAINRMDDDA